jgi:hypothetical protein
MIGLHAPKPAPSPMLTRVTEAVGPPAPSLDTVKSYLQRARPGELAEALTLIAASIRGLTNGD